MAKLKCARCPFTWTPRSWEHLPKYCPACMCKKYSKVEVMEKADLYLISHQHKNSSLLRSYIEDGIKKGTFLPKGGSG